MKFIAISIFLLILSINSSANPYFRIMGYGGPTKPVVGASLNPSDLSQSEASTMFPLVTHSPKDGCFLPSLVCESWSPLSVGLAVNSGRFRPIVAPLVNVLPSFQNTALKVLNLSSNPKLEGLKALLRPLNDAKTSFSAGPQFFIPMDKTQKGEFRFFTGLAMEF